LKAIIPSLAALVALAATSGLAAKPVITYQPPADEERPLLTSVVAGPEGSDFAFELTFDKLPWGDTCRPRCANATLFVDLDDDAATGLQLGKGTKETGADIAVTVQGASEYLERGVRNFLRVRVRQLSTSSLDASDGDVVLELDHRKDGERLQSDGDTVWILVNMVQLNVPSGRKARVIYHPPGVAAIEGSTGGMRTGTRKAGIFKTEKKAVKGAKAKGKKRARKAE